MITTLKDWFLARIRKPHIVKTGLPPKPFYEAETRILYSVMECLRFYIEEDRGGEWQVISEEQAEQEIQQGWSDPSWHEQIREQGKREEEFTRIYNWWKTVYLPAQENYNFNSYEEEAAMEAEATKNLIFIIQNREVIWS